MLFKLCIFAFGDVPLKIVQLHKQTNYDQIKCEY